MIDFNTLSIVPVSVAASLGSLAATMYNDKLLNSTIITKVVTPSTVAVGTSYAVPMVFHYG